MKLSFQIATALPVLLFALPALAHNAGAFHDHGIGYLLILAVLVLGVGARLRQ